MTGAKRKQASARRRLGKSRSLPRRISVGVARLIAAAQARDGVRARDVENHQASNQNAAPGAEPDPLGVDAPPRPNVLVMLRTYSRALGDAVGPLTAFSAVVNLLLLVAPLYMLQVYDRVLTSGSSDTLFWLTAIAAFLLFIYGAAEAGRRRTASLALERLDAALGARAFRRFEASGGSGAGLSGDLALLARTRPLLQSQLLFPFLDLPFVPLFLGVLFLVHPVLGAVGLMGAAVIVAIAVIAEIAARGAGDASAAATTAAQTYADEIAGRRTAMAAMGLVGPAYGRWRDLKDRAGLLQIEAARRDGVYAAASRAVRQVLQILMLAVGAGLAIAQQISPGAIVAGSIIVSRALGPIDQIVGGWRNVVHAAAAWGQLRERLAAAPSAEKATPLPPPAPVLTLERLAVAAPGASRAGGAPLIRPFTLELSAGALVALVGPNGAGKTTLLQTIAGAAAPAAGAAALGGRSVHAWPGADRGRHIGFLPQDPELLPGAIAENIARGEAAEPDDIYAAAQEVGAHEAILRLPKGYDTTLGPENAGGVRLSAGQSRQIALARAFFRAPVLLLLDEPTATLDAEAAAGVIAAMARAAARGAIVIASTHDQALIAASKTVLAIRGGAVLSADSKTYLASLADGAAGGAAPAQFAAPKAAGEGVA